VNKVRETGGILSHKDLEDYSVIIQPAVTRHLPVEEGVYDTRPYFWSRSFAYAKRYGAL
jgi:gamma-glutamyltranspeptidase